MNAVSIYKIVVPCCQTIEFMPVSDIVRIEALQNYARLQLVDGSEFISTNNLGHYRKQLEGKGFYLCHKSHLVQKDKIVRFHKDGFIELINGTLIPVARRRRDSFINELIEVRSEI